MPVTPESRANAAKFRKAVFEDRKYWKGQLKGGPARRAGVSDLQAEAYHGRAVRLLKERMPEIRKTHRRILGLRK